MKNRLLLRAVAIATAVIGIFMALDGPSQHIPPKREFRAVWVATVNNIDWPSSSRLTPAQQMQEFADILDKLQASGINAVIVQVRPSADAFYRSKYEPWSEWLTGKQGRPAEPYFDPLAFMIAEAHLRHIELHAWINPYRAVANQYRNDIHPDHVSKKHPEWMLDFGQVKMLNPGIPEVRKYIVDVIADMVANYDVDGVHFDDYFYPYPSNEYKLADDATYKKYGQNFRYKADWRRNNVNMLVKETHQAIKSVKSWVKFGISPYGVWRNSDLSAYGSETKSGITSYDHLHADVRLWLQQGWIDYVMPQLYQNIAHKGKPFKKLVTWWAQNCFDKHLYIGHATYRLFDDESNTWHSYQEMPTQVRFSRNVSKVFGNAYYSCKSLLKNNGSFRDSLSRNIYKYPALSPPMPWLDATPPLPPANLEVKRGEAGNFLRWETPPAATDGEAPTRYVLYRFKKGDEIQLNDPRNIKAILHAHTNSYTDLSPSIGKGDHYVYVLTALDRLNNESNPCYPMNEPEPGEEEEDAAVASNAPPTPKKPAFDPSQPISNKYDVTFEQASHFFKLAVKTSKSYLGQPVED